MDESKLLSQFGERLRELRKGKGLTQEALAERAGLNAKFLGLVERGHDLRLVNVFRIASGLDMGIPELFAFCFPTKRLPKRREELLSRLLVVLETASDRKVEKIEVFLSQIL